MLIGKTNVARWIPSVFIISLTVASRRREISRFDEIDHVRAIETETFEMKRQISRLIRRCGIDDEKILPNWVNRFRVVVIVICNTMKSE